MYRMSAYNTYAQPSQQFMQAIADLPKDYGYLIVFHLSQNNLRYLLAWAKGVPVLSVISISYSENPEVKKELSKYVNIVSTHYGQITETIMSICQSHSERKVILVEIGGYSASIANQLPNVVMSVEDTTRGHVRFQEHEQILNYPVVSIARTRGKQQEDDAVGHAIAVGTERALASANRNISNEKVLVLGYGGVGRAAAKYLKPKAMEVFVYDPNLTSQELAIESNFPNIQRRDALRAADVIVGCSGYRSIEIEDTVFFKNNAMLFSGSSRQVELPYEHFRSMIDPALSNELIETCRQDNQIFHVAYKGQPINFYYDVGLGQVFDIPMTLLAESVTYGLTHALENKLYELPEAYKSNIKTPDMRRDVNKDKFMTLLQ